MICADAVVRRRRRFGCAPQSVPAARRFARRALRGADARVRESVELMVTELASNCVRHAASAFELTVIRRPRAIRVEARDFGAGEPVMRNPTVAGEAGRGLRIVDTLASSWGVEQLAREGKTVWFEVALARTCRSAQRRLLSVFGVIAIERNFK